MTSSDFKTFPWLAVLVLLLMLLPLGCTESLWLLLL